MQVIFGVDKIRKFPKPVLAIGVFDGLHRGHVKILRATSSKARRIGGTAMCLTFWPHPQEAGHLYSLKHRLSLIAGCGIKVCVVIDFNRRFSRISARDFAKFILFEKIHPAHIYIGENFTFGRGGSGDFRTLQRLSAACRFGLKVFAVLKSNNRPISSTHIRALIREGRLQQAANLLGRAVSVLGTVVRGDARGAKLGFPTANIDPHHEVVPPPGVYAVRVVFAGRSYQGVCNIGRNPTFISSAPQRRIEVYILAFKKNIYGRDIEVRFIKKIRNEKKFAASPLLAAQVHKDALAAKRVFSSP